MNKKYSAKSSSSLYTVGAAARLAGINTSTIRNWERRHAAIRPVRASNGQRRFSLDDVQRLQALAALTRAGHSISALAHLSRVELEALNGEAGGRASRVAANDDLRLRVVTVGARAGAHMQALTDRHGALDLVRQFAHADDLLRDESDIPCDLLVAHTPHILPGTAEWLHGLRRRLQPKQTLLVYEFAPLELARSLRDASTSVLQGFGHLDPFLRLWLPAGASASVLQEAEAGARTAVREPPSRGYTMANLMQLQQRETDGLLCDCQSHLARMLEQIYDFEDYTDQCADLSAADRQAHQEIRRMMLNAREQVEAALRTACSHAERAPAPETP